MKTHFIELKELRLHLTRIASQAHKHRERYIVLRKNEPIYEIRPLSKKEVKREKFIHDIELAEEDVRNGRVYTHEEVKHFLGL